MIVQCTSLPKGEHLTVGQSYPIYAVEFRDGDCRYYICDSPGDAYPYSHSAAHFELTDATIPAGWSFSPGETMRLAPQSWNDFPYFYESLLDGVPAALVVFRAIQKSLDDEAPDPRPLVTVYVRLLNEGTTVYRPVSAYFVSDELALIAPAADYDGESEEWEFAPGEKVVLDWFDFGEGEVLVAVRRWGLKG
ncbi:hypothetical protein EON80_24445 [bacterium]|nr:MAG: hypothetical protein EON80_24445 [bacterium]